jgi:hypothetical protein
MTDNVVAQLHQALVDAIRRTRPSAMHKSVTVAEIYQDLVPYKSARSLIGFELNADYEHALMRLLAGEGDLARIEPREVRDKLRIELESPNPDVGIFRNYAACDVSVDVGEAELLNDDDDFEDLESWEDELVGPAIVPEPRAEEIQAALGTPFEIAASEPEEEVREIEPVPEAPPRVGPHEPETCAFCGGLLPSGRMANYCPFCGSDQSQQPCRNCGELLDPLWRFCIACGTRVQRLGDHLN